MKKVIDFCDWKKDEKDFPRRKGAKTLKGIMPGTKSLPRGEFCKACRTCKLLKSSAIIVPNSGSWIKILPRYGVA
jgi:hypothetical protein